MAKKFPLKDWLTGLITEHCTRAFEPGEPVEPDEPDVPVEPDEPAVEPIAYFYGHRTKEGEETTHTFDGVEYVGAILPEVPDRVAYPVKVIYTTSYAVGTKKYSAYVGYEMVYEKRDEGYRFGVTKVGKYLTTPVANPETWSEVDITGVASPCWIATIDINYYKIFWTNTTIFREDGSVFLEKTDPIPIYE